MSFLGSDGLMQITVVCCAVLLSYVYVVVLSLALSEAKLHYIYIFMLFCNPHVLLLSSGVNKSIQIDTEDGRDWGVIHILLINWNPFFMFLLCIMLTIY